MHHPPKTILLCTRYIILSTACRALCQKNNHRLDMRQQLRIKPSVSMQDLRDGHRMTMNLFPCLVGEAHVVFVYFSLSTYALCRRMDPSHPTSLSASTTVIAGDTVSGLGVMMSDTAVASGSNPLATTLIRRSFGVTIPAR